MGSWTLKVEAHSYFFNAWTSWERPFTVVANPPVIAVESPVENGGTQQPFAVTGYAFDYGGTNGTGVDFMQVYACPEHCNAGNATMIGTATYGLSRPDVATTYGDPRLEYSGYSFTVNSLSTGWWTLQVWIHSSFTLSWTWVERRVYVGQVSPHMAIDAPAVSASVTQPFTVSGWAIDAGAGSGTGVDDVQIQGWRNPGSGQWPIFWGFGTRGGSRPDVAAVYGAQFTNSGYTLSVSGQPADRYWLAVYAHLVSNIWQFQTRTIYVNLPTVALTLDRQGLGTGGISATGLSCPGGSSTQGLPCGASYTTGTVLTVTAVPDAGSTFTGWSGVCSGTGACQVTLDSAKFVAAVFSKTPTTWATTYYHTDLVGSVRAITDEAGNVVTRHDYLPFGDDSAPLTGDPLRFAGKQLDPETANEYFEARYLRTNWGRFLTPDPVDGNEADPQSWNRYAYARNNPLSQVDPSGETNEPVFTATRWVPLPFSNSSSDPFLQLTDNGWCLRVNGGTCEFGDLDQWTDFINTDTGGWTGGEGTGGTSSLPVVDKTAALAEQKAVVGTPAEVATAQNAIAEAKAELKKSTCSGLFAAGAASALSIIDNTIYQFYGDRTPAPTAFTAAVDRVFINRTGAFMDLISGEAFFGVAGLTGTQKRSSIILHEAKHQEHRLNPSTSFLPDGSSLPIMLANQQLVLRRCP